MAPVILHQKSSGCQVMKSFFKMLATLDPDWAVVKLFPYVFEKRGYFGIVSTTLPASTEPFKFIKIYYIWYLLKKKKKVYWKWVYLLNYKCFIIAVCMALCGNICFSGFYSDDVRCSRFKVGKRLSELHIWRTHECVCHTQIWLDLENKHFAKTRKANM